MFLRVFQAQFVVDRQPSSRPRLPGQEEQRPQQLTPRLPRTQVNACLLSPKDASLKVNWTLGPVHTRDARGET